MLELRLGRSESLDRRAHRRAHDGDQVDRSARVERRTSGPAVTVETVEVVGQRLGVALDRGDGLLDRQS